MKLLCIFILSLLLSCTTKQDSNAELTKNPAQTETENTVITQNAKHLKRGDDLEIKITAEPLTDTSGARVKIDGIDISKEQLEVAKHYLKKEINEKRMSLHQKDAQTFSLNKPKYDAAFLCWFLEHVPDPLKVLKRTKAHLKPGAKIYCTEVFNQTHFMEPYSAAYLKYWFEFNDYQWSIGGHPFVGSMLGHYLKEAGFVDIQVQSIPLHFDSREPERRAAFIDFFYKILLSAKETLLDEGRITPEQLKQMDKEVEKAKKTKESVFYFAPMRATARVPARGR